MKPPLIKFEYNFLGPVFTVALFYIIATNFF